MSDNDLFPTDLNNNSFDEEGGEDLPLITKERTQKFELLLHLIPNLKQHLILSGASGMGKTLLLDMLYDLDREAWQCCFVQGNAELSFEQIEAQLTKTMLRNKHESLDKAFHDFQEQHKKIVLIIDDAGLLVSGLMTTLIDYAVSQPALKLIFSLTPADRQNHRKTDKGLDNCYLVEIPALTKRQCLSFLRHLASKPRTYDVMQNMDAKLLDKIYRETQGNPGLLIAHFKQLSRDKQNDYTKWLLGFAGLLIATICINQGVRYFKGKSANDALILPAENVENVSSVIEKNTTLPTESVIKNDTDIVPEFKLDIEQMHAPVATNSVTTTESETVASVEKSPEKPLSETLETPTEKAAPEPVVDVKSTVENEKVTQPVVSEPAKIIPIVEAPIQPQNVVPIVAAPISKLPVIATPLAPTIAFPKVEPAAGVKIQPLPEKATITTLPLVAPEVKNEPQKLDIKAIEIPVIKEKKSKVNDVISKTEMEKTESTKKAVLIDKISKLKEAKESKSTAQKVAFREKITAKKVEKKIETQVKKIDVKDLKEAKKVNVVTPSPPVTASYTLQLITLSSDAAITKFQKKYLTLNKDFRVVKSGIEGQERFALMYGGFANIEEATKARQTLPPEFASALPRKLNPTP